MALLEGNNTCCVCDEKEVHYRIGGMPAFYCVKCFKEHKDDILLGAPWVRWLRNAEHQRRKRRNRLIFGGYCIEPAYILDGIFS
jgi:hypothetical protein